jgi:hypothetical protein
MININNNKIFIILSWFSLTLIFLYLLFVLSPGRGAHWSSDDGHVLLNAWNLSENGILSKDFPQQPMYIVQALLMKMGIEQYIHFRYLFYFITLLGCILFYSGLDKEGLKSPFVPIASIATLSISFTTISYFFQFFLIGMGLYFYSKKIKTRVTPILLAFAGFFLGLQGLSAGIAIGMFVLVVLMMCLDGELRKSFFSISFFFTIATLWLTYTYFLGLDNLLTVPPGHTAETTYFFGRMKQIMMNNIFVLFICLIFYLALRFIVKIQAIYFYFLISSLITLIFISEFMWNTYSEGPSMAWRTFFFKYIGDIYINRFGIRDLILMQVPMFSYFLLLNSFFYYLFVNSFEEKKNVVFKTYFKTIIKPDNLFFFFGVVGYLLLFSSYTVGSNVFYHTLLSVFSGVFLGISIIFIGKFIKSNNNYLTKVLGYILITPWIFLFITLGLKFNIPTLQPVLGFQDNQINTGYLKGIKETETYLKALDEINSTYNEYGCANKTLITFDYIPLLIYSLNNKFSASTQFVRPTHGFPSSKIERLLMENPTWCIIDTSTTETLEYVSNGGKPDPREYIRSKVIKFSLQSRRIEGPSEDIPSLTIYSK